MNSLLTRVLSAAVAIATLFCLVYFFEINGLRFLCLLAVILGTRELIRILFNPEDSLTIKALFYFLMVFIFISTVKMPQHSGLFFSISVIVFFSLGLILQKKFEGLQTLSVFLFKSILGFFYLGLLPGFACKLLDFPNGVIWFLTLLGVVLSGDTFAYIFGLLWGKRKIMPAVSPKKTVVGSMGGLFGSCLAALVASSYLPNSTVTSMIFLALLTGASGQFGDFFESLLKRIADKKDSGSLMPGHGGVLDRIDGILFGAPVVYIFALFLEGLF